MDWKSSADALKSYVDVALRLLIAVAIILVLVAPGLFPFLTRFTVKSGEVNIFGSKFEIAEIGTLIPGVEIRENRILLQGKDISTLPDTVARLTTTNNELTQANKDLSDHLKEATSLLDQLTKDAQNPNQPPKSVEYVQKLQQQQQQLQTKVAETEISAKALAVTAVAPASPSTLSFGVVFSADKNKEQAMDEAKKAPGLSDAPIALYSREKLVRSVAGFATRDAAVAALPPFRAKWPGAYVIDLRTWCPAASTVVAPAGNAPAEIDCHF
jgi:uncharacterized membrane-anchored protein YhcB (DUF1043 family)